MIIAVHFCTVNITDDVKLSEVLSTCQSLFTSLKHVVE